MQVWFNPACSKCRAARAQLDDSGVAYTLRDYLGEPPTTDELEQVLAALGLQPWDITRFGEPVAAELGLADRPRADPAAWVALLAAHPQLIQRPILVTEDGRAVVGRSPEAVRAALAGEPAGSAER